MSKLNQEGLISKYQVARSLNDFMQKNIISIQFTEEQLNRLKYEEEKELLDAYKKLGKASPSPSSGGGESEFDIDSELGLDETDFDESNFNEAELEGTGGENNAGNPESE